MAKMNKMREQLIEEFTKALSENTIPWERGWNVYRNQNALTSKAYRGANSLWLSMVASAKGYEDPRWCTYKQAQGKGWHVKKGEKGTSVEFWAFYDTKTKRTLSALEREDLLQHLTKTEAEERIRLISKTYVVFNGEQIEGIPAFEKKPIAFDEKEVVKLRDQVILEFSLAFIEGGGSAFYRERDDSITMPSVKDFNNQYTYLSTFLHEVAHSTGHQKRMNRDLSGSFGTPEYAKEELRAEISSAFTSQMLGVRLERTEESLQNHKAYIQNWMQVIKNDPNQLFRAINEAEKITDYIIEEAKLKSYVQQIDTSMEQKTEERLIIYQIKEEQEEGYLFQSMEKLEKFGKVDIIQKENFRVVYDSLYPMKEGTQEEKLEEIYMRFNQSHPEGYQGHSLSVGDVVSIVQNGQTRTYFVDNVGFQELPDFEKNLKKDISAEKKYSVIRTVGEMESKTQMPEEQRMTTWFGDYCEYEMKPGVTTEQIQNRYEEIEKNRNLNQNDEKTKTVSKVEKEKEPEKKARAR